MQDKITTKKQLERIFWKCDIAQILGIDAKIPQLHSQRN